MSLPLCCIGVTGAYGCRDSTTNVLGVASRGRVPGISGATILGDGSVALIVDVSALMRETRSGHSENAMRAVTAEKHELGEPQGGRFSTEAMAAA